MKELSKGSWHAWLYASTWSSELPKWKCTYYPKVLIAILLFVPSYPSHIINWFEYRRSRNIMWFEMNALNGILYTLFLSFFGLFFTDGKSGIIATHLYGILFFIMLILLIAGLSMLFIGIHVAYKSIMMKIRRRKKKKEAKKEDDEPGFFQTIQNGYIALRNKNCEEIVWKK